MNEENKKKYSYLTFDALLQGKVFENDVEIVSIQDSDNKNNQDSYFEITHAEVLKDLTKELTLITELKEKQAVALSILSENNIHSRFLEKLFENRKHIKRKHAPELLEAIKDVSQITNYKDSENSDLELSRRLFPKLRK